MGANSVGVNAPWSETSIIPSNARPQYTREHWKRRFQSEKSIKHFSSTLWCRNLKTQESPVSLDLCLRKTRSVKSRNYHDVIILEKLCFQNAFQSQQNENLAFSVWRPFLKSSIFGDGLVWTKGLTEEIKLCFQIPPVYFGGGLCCCCQCILVVVVATQIFQVSLFFSFFWLA